MVDELDRLHAARYDGMIVFFILLLSLKGDPYFRNVRRAVSENCRGRVRASEIDEEGQVPLRQTQVNQEEGETVVDTMNTLFPRHSASAGNNEEQ